MDDITQPLQFQRMTRDQQRTATRITQDFSAKLPQTLSDQGQAKLDQADRAIAKGGSSARNAKSYNAAGRRMQAASEVAASRTPAETNMSIDAMARRRVDQVVSGATDTRLPGESIGGAGWYFDHARQIRDDVTGPDGNLTVPVDNAIVGGSLMSPRTDPEVERGAVKAIASAVGGGMVGDTPFRDAPIEDITAMREANKRNPDNPGGVDWKAMSGPAEQGNISRAVDIMRGASGDLDSAVNDVQNPGTAPKTWSYTNASRNAAAAIESGAEGEYMMRANDLGAKIRGESHQGQGMLDLYGMRDSREGILDPGGHTAEDTWMRSVSMGLGEGMTKAGGDIAPGRKTFERNGVKENAAPNPAFTGESVYHAVQNAATQRAGQMLGEQFTAQSSSPYEIPSVMVQETAWTAQRRNAPKRVGAKASADTAYNTELGNQTKQVQPDGRTVKAYEQNPMSRGQQKLF